MMNRKKKLLAFLLCASATLCCSLGLSACEQSSNSGGIFTEKETLEFSMNSKDMFIYSSFQLHVNQMQGVTFTSSDESVAIVDENGLVYAKGFGEATITARLGELQTQCTIRVVGENIFPSIEVAQENVSLVWSENKQFGSSFIVNPQIKFNGNVFTDGEFTFTSSNPAVAIVDSNGEITAKGYGNAVISIQGSWREGFDVTVLNKTVNVKVMPNAEIELLPERTIINTVNATIDGKTYIAETAFATKVTVDGEMYDAPIEYVVNNNVVEVVGNTVVANKIGTASITAKCIVDGIEIYSMPMVIEVVAPTILATSERVIYNVKETPVYAFTGIEGDFVSLSINGVKYDEYVDVALLSVDLSEVYENVLGDSFIEIVTSKYTYQYQVKFVTHIITDGKEFKTCITTDKSSTIYAILENDITFSVGNFTASSTAFSGVFDGQGHTIDARGTKLTSVYGLFGRLKGELRDFALVNVTVYGKECTVLGERIYEGGAVKNLYVQATYEENTDKNYSSLDSKGTLYYCGLFNRGFRFENVIANIRYPDDVDGYALCAYNNVILVQNSYCFGNMNKMAQTYSAVCYPKLSELLSTNLGALTYKNGFSEYWYFDDQMIKFGDLVVEDKLVKSAIETEESSITLNLGDLTKESIQKLYIDGEEIVVPTSGVLVLDAGDYTANEYHIAKLYTTSGIIEQAFMFVVEAVIEVPERNLITEFYKDKANYPIETLSIDNALLGQENVYGTASIASNSATMYMTLSSKYLGELFADEKVTAITFDIILSTGTAKIQRGKNAETLQEGATSSSGSYYVYATVLTRDHYEKYGKTTDLMLRYTGGGSSAFFYVDNLIALTGEIVEDENDKENEEENGGDSGNTQVGCLEGSLIKDFYGVISGSNVYHELAEVTGVMSQDNVVYGKNDLGDGRTNSGTMYMTISYVCLTELFADQTASAISFDLILSADQKVLEINKAAFKEGVSYTITSEMVDGVTYYIYRVTMMREYYNTLTKDITLRYKFGKDAEGNTVGADSSTFFYVDNLTVIKNFSESGLIKDFYAVISGSNVYHELAEVTGVMSQENVAYGKDNLGDGRTNSGTMYMTISYDYLTGLFAEENVTAISFDLILSADQKVLEINKAAFIEGVSYTITSETVDGVTYYIYRVTMTRAYYSALTKDITLRYKFGKDAEGNTIGADSSTFFYVDNLTLLKGEE